MKRSAVILAIIILSSGFIYPHTRDTIRAMRQGMRAEAEAYEDVSLACPEIALPSVTGPKNSFRYIDAGCEQSLTIRPSFGVSGGQITGYTVHSIPYAPPFPLDQGTKIFINLDDIWGDIIQLPFKFCFFENTYSQAVVGANGLVSFNTHVANQASGWSMVGYSNIPSRDFSGYGGQDWSNAIYGVFEDIDPNRIISEGTGGSIRYGVLGSYPCRTLTVSWNRVPNFSCYSNSKYWDSFQIVLYEGTNVIDVYVKHKSRCASWNLGRGIIGIQNETCTNAIAAPHRNTEDSWTADNEAWRFTPVSTPQYTITYYEGMGTKGRVLGQGDAITINPSNLSAITARLQFTAANGDSFDLCDTAVIVHTEIAHEQTRKVLCDGEPYYWRGRTYTTSGTYYDTVGNHAGCYDKIYELILTINQQTGTKTTHSICEGESYTWKGKSYSQPGTYANRYKNESGCEIVDTLVLVVNKPYLFVTRDTICAGSTYTWRGKNYTRSGTYTDPYKTKAGCDSIYRLDLVVGEKYLFPTQAKVCDGGSYKWRGRTYWEAGVYWDSLKTQYGCDSVYKLDLKRAQNYRIEEFDTICRGETYTWHGKSYSEPGVYYDCLQSSDGCDSIHVLNLQVNRTYLFVDEDGLRSDGKYRWRNKLFTSPGQYYDSLKTEDGCDSVYQLNLKYVRSQFYSYVKYICEEDARYQWRGKYYTESGVYWDSLTNVNGADSVYKLTLVISAPVYVEEKAAICTGETYTWRGKELSIAGTYQDTVTNSTDCGTIFQLNLKVGKPFKKETSAYLCEGGSYTWRGYTYTKPGIYYDEYRATDGCDSIYQLNLTPCRNYYFPSSATICEGTTYTWRGKTFSESGIYWDSLKTQHGCDSVYQLELLVEKPYLFEESATICANEKYDWRGKVYSAAGTYYDRLTTINGCDSVYVLHLSTKQAFYKEDYASICEGEKYTWRGQNYTQADTYYDRYTTKDGCDSVYALHLTVNPTFLHRETAYICGGEAYRWHNKSYSEAGVYRDTLTSIHGCDSVLELTLGIAENYYYEETYATCEGSFYSWHGRDLSQSGVYWDSLKTAFGCDSIYKLTVTFYPIYHFVTEATICEGETFAWRDSVYAIDSVYYEQFATMDECDSLYELRLTVLPTYHISETQEFCQGETITWHGRQLSEPGVYVDSLSARTSCDSIIQLTLIEHPAYNIQVYDTINEGDNYTWCGQVYTESGEYHAHLYSIDGCDSLLTLFLVVHPKYNFVTNATICEGESYPWQGENYTTEGVYYKSYQTIHGNDSTYELHLTVNPIFYIPSSTYLCAGSSMSWRGRELSEPGLYYDSLKSSAGCDSVYALEVMNAPTYEFNRFDTICKGESYTFEGKKYNESGVYTARYTTAHGCDSIYTLSLYLRPFPVPQMPISDVCADDEYIYIYLKPDIDFPIDYQIHFDDAAKNNGFVDLSGLLAYNTISIPIPKKSGDSYVCPNTYSGSLILNSEYCAEQHDFNFSFNVLYPTSVVVQKFNDVLVVQNERYNGGFVFTHYQWYADGMPIADAVLPYFYGEGDLPASTYQVLLTRESEGFAMLTCPIEPIKNVGVDSPSADIYITPTILDKNQPIVAIYHQGQCGIHMYDLRGRKVLSVDLPSQETKTSIALPATEGIYILHASFSNGSAKTCKIIIQ